MCVLERRLLLSVSVEENRFRFFAIELHGSDSADAEIRRWWGRIGTPGRHRVESYATIEDARRAWDALLERRHKRAYVDAAEEDLRAAQRLLAWCRAGARMPYQLCFPSAAGF